MYLFVNNRRCMYVVPTIAWENDRVNWKFNFSKMIDVFDAGLLWAIDHIQSIHIHLYTYQYLISRTNRI